MASAAYAQARAKALEHCEDAKVKGAFSPATVCATASHTTRKIEQAVATLEATIGKACGSAGAICGGGDDRFGPMEIGFAASCLDVQGPNGLPCGWITPVPDLTTLAECVDCVIGYAPGCVDAAAVPGLMPYPSECQ